jgi:hypothetical protein
MVKLFKGARVCNYEARKEQAAALREAHPWLKDHKKMRLIQLLADYLAFEVVDGDKGMM